MSQQSHGQDELGEDTFLDDFLTDIELQGKSDETLRTYQSNLRNFLSWYDGDPRTIAWQDLRDFLSHLKHERPGKDGTAGVSASTINNYFACLNTYYRFLEFEGIVDTNIVPGFRERYVHPTSPSSGETRQLITVEEMSTLQLARLDSICLEINRNAVRNSV